MLSQLPPLDKLTYFCSKENLKYPPFSKLKPWKKKRERDHWENTIFQDIWMLLVNYPFCLLMLGRGGGGGGRGHACVWISEAHMAESILPLRHMEPGDWTQIIRVSIKSHCLVSHPSCSDKFLMTEICPTEQRTRVCTRASQEHHWWHDLTLKEMLGEYTS